MKKNLLSPITIKQVCSTLVLFFLLTNQSIKAQAWQWAKSQGGNADDGARISITDASGNVYVAGTFYSASMPIGTLTPLTNAGVGTSDAFLAKFDPNGNAIWSQRIGGTQYDDISGVTIDPNTGLIYVAGSYNSTLVSVPPASMGNSNSTGNFYDCYFAVFNPIGSCAGLVSFGGNGDQFATGCVFSGSLNCLYISGHYATPTMTCAPVTLTNTSASGKSDVFLARYTTAGTLTWARTTGGINSDDRSNGISVDAAGSPYFGGSFSPSTLTGPTVIGTSTLTSVGLQDIYITKYNSSGTFQWARSMGSTSGGDYLTHVKVDGVNDVCLSGYYQTSAISIGTVSLPNSGGYDAFLAKYNSAGTMQWAKKIGANYDEYAYSLDVDGSNNIYLTGAFNSSVVAVGSNILSNSTSTVSYTDAFVAKYNSSGTTQWAVNPFGAHNEIGYGISSDALGNVYAVGQFNVAGPAAFGTTTLTSSGLFDSYLAKIGCLTTYVSGFSSVCQGSSVTLTASGATTYSWSTGATTPTISVSPTVSTIYTVTGTSGACIGTPTTYSVTFLPASLSTGSNLNLLCKQKAVINATCNPASPTSVVWSPATNLSSSTALNPTVTAGSPTNYTVNVTLNNGCILSGTVNVSSYAQTPNICQVTVDSLGVNNEIYWEKTLYPQADSFIVYREVSTNVYKRIAGLKYSNFSMYVDTNRSIGPANGNPNLTYYKYKLQIKDSCGNASALSLWHETIFIQDQLNGNFNWNSYAIELSSPPVSNYNLKRRDISTGTETLVVSTVGNLASDPQYNTFWPNPNVRWFVDAIGFNCVPSIIVPPKNNNNQIQLIKTKTKSNQSNDKQLSTGITGYDLSNVIKVFPNPAHDYINVDLNGLDKTEISVEIRNMLGQTVYTVTSLNQYLNINTNSIAGGVYMVNVIQNNKTIAVKKVVVEK